MAGDVPVWPDNMALMTVKGGCLQRSMKNDDNKIKEVRNTVNLISGAYTLPLIEKLFPNSQKISDMDDIYFAIAALVDTGRMVVSNKL